MQADYELEELSMSGTLDELKRMMKIVNRYSFPPDNERFQYFDDFVINGEKSLEYVTDDEIENLLASGEIELSARGPCSGFGELNDVGLFREMAEAAPKAAFDAHIAGYDTYTIQSLDCTLENGLLYITAYLGSDEAEAEYAKDFLNKLPYEMFKNLFKVYGDEFDEEAYSCFAKILMDVFSEGFNNSDFDLFASELECFKGKTELDEDEFKNIVTTQLTPLGIMDDMAEFKYLNECGETNHYVYNPVTKEYVE